MRRCCVVPLHCPHYPGYSGQWTTLGIRLIIRPLQKAYALLLLSFVLLHSGGWPAVLVLLRGLHVLVLDLAQLLLVLEHVGEDPRSLASPAASVPAAP